MNTACDYPWYLTLLTVIPFLWWVGYRSLAGLGALRRFVALALRAIVLSLVVLALAQFQFVWTSPRLTVLYLLDQSLSIPESHRRAMSDYVNAEVERHRNAKREDRAGVIVFAREPAVEYPAVAENLQLTGAFEAATNGEYTDLSSAFRLAQAMFPADSAKRIVIVTDGNENLGNALEQAQALIADGVGIDVVPVRYTARGEVAIEKVVSPSATQKGQPFDLRVVVSNAAEVNNSRAQPIKGRIKVFRRTKDRETQLTDEEIVVEPGKRVFTVREKIEAADFVTYEARFVPDNPHDDAMPQNNQATSFTHVRGQGQVLLIEDFENQGEFDHLVEQLRRANLQVAVMTTNELFASLADLQPFDTVVLANVPREAFSEDQVKMLVNNTQQMGSGLIMLGGPNSFGAGGWTNSDLEAAMPVDFQIKSAKVVPMGALALVIDHSGSMDGEKLSMARAAAMAAVDVLSPHDYVSVSAFDSVAIQVVPMVKVEARSAIKGRISRLDSGGGTFMEPGMTMAYQSFKKAQDAAIRHMLILTDGQTSGSGYENMVKRYRREGITVSTVAVGSDADQQLLQRMALAGGGKFYHATTPKILPRIFQKEARMVSRPLIFEKQSGMTPSVKFPHEMLKGINQQLPPITGYVLTQVKASPLVEVALVAPQPAGEDNRTLLASWTYGLGKAVAFTSDVGKRWTTAWTSTDEQEKLFTQMVRWSMRPADTSGNFTVVTNAKNGKTEVIVDALDKDHAYLNFLNVSGRIVGPDLKPRDIELRQIAPGRYTGEFETQDAGSYFLTVLPGSGSSPIISGVNVPYSREYLDREANEPLLSTLAGLVPKGGEAGVMIDDAEHRGLATLLEPPAGGAERLLVYDTFRHTLPKAATRQDVWPQLVLLASCFFFADIFVRRVRLDLGWVPQYAAALRDRLRGREAAPVVTTFDRLKGRKAEVVESLDARREAARFEPTRDELEMAKQPVLEDMPAISQPPSPSSSSRPLTPESNAEEQSYTSRLLKAKQRVWDDRDKKTGS